MKKSSGFILRKISDEFVLVPVKETVFNCNKLIVLNNSAAYLWHLLENDIERERLIENFSKKYPRVNITDIENDIDRILEEFLKNNLLAQQ